MAVGIITTPASWSNGTVATPTWFQSAQDNINLASRCLPSASSTYSSPPAYMAFDDFDTKMDVSTFSSGMVGSYYVRINTNALYGTNAIYSANTCGVLTVYADTNALTQTAITASYSGLGTRDFAWRSCLRVRDYTKLETSAATGLQFGIFDNAVRVVCFNAVSDSAYWKTIVDGSYANTAIGISNDTFTTFEACKIGSTLNMYINGTNVYSASYTTAFVDPKMQIYTGALAPGAGTYRLVDIDWISHSFIRT